MASPHIIDWIERDIQERGLEVGAPYLTAEEVGRLIGVSRATADRAMKELSARHVLMRRQRSGTFVGPRAAVAVKSTGSLTTIHIVADLRAIEDGPLSFDEIARYLADASGSSRLEFHVVSKDEKSRTLRQLVAALSAARDLRQAVVLVSGDAEDQKALAESRLTAVHIGASAPEAEIPFIAFDAVEIAKKLADSARARGAEILVFADSNAPYATQIESSLRGTGQKVHATIGASATDEDTRARVVAAFKSATAPILVWAWSGRERDLAIAAAGDAELRLGVDYTIVGSMRAVGAQPVGGLFAAVRSNPSAGISEWLRDALAGNARENSFKILVTHHEAAHDSNGTGSSKRLRPETTALRAMI
jgi:DNA-binding transcriptional regulator YhcF (GntR family)